MEPLDYLGNPISIGDEVIFSNNQYRVLMTGTVISMAPQSVVIEFIWSDRKKTLRQFFGQLIVKSKL